MRNNIYIALSSFAKHGTYPLEILEKNNFNVKINETGKRLETTELIEYAKDADAIIAGVEIYDEAVLESLTKLKCISRAGVGIDNIDIDTAEKNKILIKNTPDVIITPVAELTLGMILCLQRKLLSITSDMRLGKWKKTTGSNLEGKKIGILGVGRIGKKVAELLNCFGAQVLLCDPIQDKTWAKEFSFNYMNMREIFEVSDIISVHSSNIKKKHLIGLNEIKIIKKGCILINTSRGNLVDERAIIYGLENEILSGVGLDVFEQEPYTGELRKYNDIIMTPHIATLTSESRLEMETQASENIVEFFNK